ncbi:hypothetical protein J2125_003994 [Erwinia toletana]|uniref:Uncharacterized protein n=1 Tax=Winslowiella toletana TaxID=92490 RepID=A0ABS4PDX3_9GAMM|nr:hypothetical protein [Winslowiella toletana]
MLNDESIEPDLFLNLVRIDLRSEFIDSMAEGQSEEDLATGAYGSFCDGKVLALITSGFRFSAMMLRA